MSKPHHLSRQIATVWQEAAPHDAPEMIILDDFCAYGLPFAQLDQRPFRSHPIWMIKFRRIDTANAYRDIADHDRIAIHDMTSPVQHSFGRRHVRPGKRFFL